MRSIRRPRAPRRNRAASGPAGRGRIRILLAMQARLDREAMASLLGTQPDFQVVGCASTGSEVVSTCLPSQARVLILGTLVPWPEEVSGIDAVRMCCPGTDILAIAPHSSDRCAQLNPNGSAAECLGLEYPSRSCLLSALAHGAHGAIHRDAPAEELFQAVRAVARGERWVGRGVEEVAPCATALSERERIVSLLLGKGRSNKEIAAELRISEGTVKKHVGHTLHKLGLHDRLQLGLFVARHVVMFETR